MKGSTHTLADRLRWHTRVGAHRLLRAALHVRSRPFLPAIAPSTVVAAAHPDDETFGCGGLIAARRAAGANVQVLFLTDGSGSHPAHPTLSPAAVAALRRTEALAATRALGVSDGAVTFLNERDGTLAHLTIASRSALIERIAEFLAVAAPAEIFLAHRRDGSSEHEAAFPLVQGALARSGIRPRLIEYPVWSWWSPRLSLRLVIQSRRVWRLGFPAQSAAKQAALACYRSQTEPTAPWTTPVLPRGFASFFATPVEYYFEE